jgi:hypothetical protein
VKRSSSQKTAIKIMPKCFMTLVPADFEHSLSYLKVLAY